jgi:hypothetical protein
MPSLYQSYAKKIRVQCIVILKLLIVFNSVSIFLKEFQLVKPPYNVRQAPGLAYKNII